MNNTYETQDYQLAVTLSTLGYRLINVDRSRDVRRAIFQFQNTPEIDNRVHAFFSDELILNPRLVLLNAKLVKDRLHAAI